MKTTTLFGTAVLAAGLLGVLPAKADGDPVAGKKVFNKCIACHDAKTDKDKVGPSLMTVVGRTAGTWESFLFQVLGQHEKDSGPWPCCNDANLTPTANPRKVPKARWCFRAEVDEDLLNVIAIEGSTRSDETDDARKSCWTNWKSGEAPAPGLSASRRPYRQFGEHRYIRGRAGVHMPLGLAWSFRWSAALP